MTTLYDNIAELVTNDPTAGGHSPLGIISDAALLVSGPKDAGASRPRASPTQQ
jgi:imidazolonepropionase